MSGRMVQGESASWNAPCPDPLRTGGGHRLRKGEDVVETPRPSARRPDAGRMVVRIDVAWERLGAEVAGSRARAEDPAEREGSPPVVSEVPTTERVELVGDEGCGRSSGAGVYGDAVTEEPGGNGPGPRLMALGSDHHQRGPWLPQRQSRDAGARSGLRDGLVAEERSLDHVVDPLLASPMPSASLMRSSRVRRRTGGSAWW